MVEVAVISADGSLQIDAASRQLVEHLLGALKPVDGSQLIAIFGVPEEIRKITGWARR